MLKPASIVSKGSFIVERRLVEIVFSEKLPCDCKSVSSLESYDSDQPLKSSDVPEQTATTATRCSSSCAETGNARSPHDLRAAEPTSDMPTLVSDDLSSFSLRLKLDLLPNDSNLASDTARMESSCGTNTDAPKTHVLQTESSFNSINSASGRNDTSRITNEIVRSVYDHVLPDCNATQLLEDFVEFAMPVQNSASKDPVTRLQGCAAATGLENRSSLNTSRLSNMVEDHNGAVGLALCISTDSAFKFRDVKPTLLSPAEDFRSIYTSSSNSQTSSADTHEALQFKPNPAHSYQDSDSIDAWLEFPVPEKSAALSVSVSRRTVWYVDITERLYYSSLKGPGLSWIADSQPAQQISSSPSGFIVWRVYRGSAFSAVGRITGKSPAGTEWREVAREVAYVAADDNVVW